MATYLAERFENEAAAQTIIPVHGTRYPMPVSVMSAECRKALLTEPNRLKSLPTGLNGIVIPLIGGA